jgi:ubiquinone/menaquinone biosynthesis C-methylase UbiE/cytosine/adenosine deaminase-related metal-dependent hydrolase
MATVANASSRSASECISSAEAFARWSQAYDEQLSPLFSLEQRFLNVLLPKLKGFSVLDVGCGTGRWLSALAVQQPANLVGIDNSPAMLARAISKCGAYCRLFPGDATSIPVADSSFDVGLASFVISYIGRLKSFASEMRRIIRPGAQLFITDLHPETAALCNWKRAFRVGDSSVQLQTYEWSLKQIVSCFEEFGFSAICLAQPHFGTAERDILERAGKAHVFSNTAGLPPIYILQLRRDDPRATSLPSADSSRVVLRRARVALGADEEVDAEIVISGKRISSIGVRRFSIPLTRRVPRQSIDLSGYLLMPGLINAHDHLEFGLFPNLGHGPYATFAEWADDIHRRDREVIEQNRRVPKDLRLWWGAIRNLLCGVTTVCHHNPISPELEQDDFPVRVLSKFGWAHSIRMYPGLVDKFNSTPADVPFIVHAGEGVSEDSANEIFQLDRMHALDNRTVIVHGLALREDGMQLINRRGAALVWCPSSNHFLFGQTHTSGSICSADRVVLGSDSSLTAAGDLLDEVRFACSRVGVDPRELYQQITTRSAEVLRLQNGEGTLVPGALGDVIAVRDRGQNAATTLAQLSYRDIELVLLGGRVQLASESIRKRLPEELALGLIPLRIENTLRWIRAPLGWMFEGAEKVLGCGLRLGGKRVANVAAGWREAGVSHGSGSRAC